LPHNVPLLTGYWPMLGTAIALLTRAGDLALIVPEDERVLARRGWVADERITSFRPGANTVSLARDGRRNVPEPACGWCARTSRHAIVAPVCALIETVLALAPIPAQLAGGPAPATWPGGSQRRA